MLVNDSKQHGVNRSNAQSKPKSGNRRLIAVSAVPALVVAAICVYLMRGSQSSYEAYPINVNGKAITAQARSLLIRLLIAGCNAPCTGNPQTWLPVLHVKADDLF